MTQTFKIKLIFSEEKIIFYEEEYLQINFDYGRSYLSSNMKKGLNQ